MRPFSLLAQNVELLTRKKWTYSCLQWDEWVSRWWILILLWSGEHGRTHYQPVKALQRAAAVCFSATLLLWICKFISRFSRKQTTTPFQKLTGDKNVNGDDFQRDNECQKVWLQREFSTNPAVDFSARSRFLRVERRHCPPCWPLWSSRANKLTRVALCAIGPTNQRDAL